MEWKDKPVKYLRDKTIEQLKFNLANDHLEIVEFEQMVKTALTTNSKAELASLTADLPAMDLVSARTRDFELAAYEEQKKITCVMSETKLNGIWSPSKQIKTLCVMGDIEIDFSNVTLRNDITYLTLTCVMGNVTIIVPPDTNVVSNVKTIMAAASNQSRGKMDYDRPTIMIEGKVVMANLDIIESR